MHRLLAPWNDPIFGFLLAQLRHRADAEDAAQEVFIRVVKGLPGYEHRGEFRAWIFRIARHQATLTAMRRQRISESFDQWAIVEQARIRRMEKELATLKSDFQKAIANKEKVIETDTQKLIEESRAYQQTKP